MAASPASPPASSSCSWPLASVNSSNQSSSQPACPGTSQSTRYNTLSQVQHSLSRLYANMIVQMSEVVTSVGLSPPSSRPPSLSPSSPPPPTTTLSSASASTPRNWGLTIVPAVVSAVVSWVVAGVVTSSPLWWPRLRGLFVTEPVVATPGAAAATAAPRRLD